MRNHSKNLRVNRCSVPDFRSSTGLFTTLRSEHKLKASGKHLFDASVYQTDSSTSSFHDMVRSLSHLVSAAKPTVFHQMLATLAEEGRLMRLYTQNVDGIDVALPSLETKVPLSLKGPWPRTIQLHGGLEKMVCSKCNHHSNFEAALFDGPEPPPCSICIETDKVRTDHAGKRSHGIGKLRPRIVLYNEHNPDEEAIGAVVGSDLRARPDAVIVVGTSMKIPGVRRIVREMCGVVRGRRDGLAVWVNQDPPPVGKDFEDCWDLVVKGACDEVARQWDSDGKDYSQCTESEAERAKERSGELRVVIESPRKESTHGIPTPAASPPTKPTRPMIKLKLNVPSLSKSTKTKINPASKGPTISQVIKNTSKSSSTLTSAKKKTTKISSRPSHQSITTAFKVTKVKTDHQTTKKPKPRSRNDGEDELSKPMAQISPQAARNNGPLPSFTSPMFPNLIKIPTIQADSLGQMDSLKRRSREIVSPTGALPRGLEMIMN